MNHTDIHRQAMSLADRADEIIRVGGDSQEAKRLYYEAYTRELFLARIYGSTKVEPSRSVLIESAKSLAKLAGIPEPTFKR